MGELDLGIGEDRALLNRLPGDGEDGLVQIVAHLAVRQKLDIGGEEKLLPFQQGSGLLQKPR